MHNDVYGAWHRYGRTQIDTRLGLGGCGDGSEASRAGVFRDLATRGLKRVLISVADGFPGVEETVEKPYPFADRRLCFLHVQRNLRRGPQKNVWAEMRPNRLYLA